MGTIFIGLSGKSGNGKDAVARFIIDRFGERTEIVDGEAQIKGYKIIRYAFADALKEEVSGKEEELSKKYNLPYEPLNKYRKLLQFYGMLKRNEDSNYWIKKLAKRIDADKEAKVILVTDVRFKNECYWLLDRGSLKDNETFLIRVNRNGYLNPDIDQNHPSETELDEFIRGGKVREGEEVFFNYEINCEDNNIEELRKDAIYVFEEIEKELDVVGSFRENLKQIEAANSKVALGII